MASYANGAAGHDGHVNAWRLRLAVDHEGMALGKRAHVEYPPLLKNNAMLARQQAIVY